MKKFEKAAYDPEQLKQLGRDMLAKWEEGDALVRATFPAADKYQAATEIGEYIRDMADGTKEMIWKNDLYQVAIRNPCEGMLHLSIKRLDRGVIHDWRHLQEIKNELVGPECEAVELDPAESRRVDTANQYHLWCATDPKYRFPVGWDEGRHCTEHAVNGSVNRPFNEGGFRNTERMAIGSRVKVRPAGQSCENPMVATILAKSESGGAISLQADQTEWYNLYLRERGVFLHLSMPANFSLFLDHKQEWTDPQTLKHFTVEEVV